MPKLTVTINAVIEGSLEDYGASSVEEMAEIAQKMLDAGEGPDEMEILSMAEKVVVKIEPYKEI